MIGWIEWLGAFFLVYAFIVVIKTFDFVEKSKTVISIARRSLQVIRSSEIDDLEKEKTMQKQARQLFFLLFQFILGAAIAMLAPLAFLWLVDKIGWMSLQGVFAVLATPIFWFLSIVFAVIVFCFPPNKNKKENSYTATERMLHLLAFKTYPLQVAVADMEDRLYADRLGACSVERPVFITGLPRAGTTLLLESFTKLPEFASHVYRDMPFVPIPLLWNRFSSSHQKQGISQQRAHGDGMLINYDSPEALEEVIWKIFWRKHYRKDRIVPWDENEENDEFVDFIRKHICKIIHLRCEKNDDPCRYISKNNLNISRIRLLHRIFPDAVIIVPFRHPISHAASLAAQHSRFLEIQEKDAFVTAYMRAIGHFDFGKTVRPVDFDGWYDKRQYADAVAYNFWLEYWTVSYHHLLEQKDYCRFISYDALCQDPTTGFKRLAHAMGSNNGDRVAEITDIHPARRIKVDSGLINSSLSDKALDLFKHLNQLSL